MCARRSAARPRGRSTGAAADFAWLALLAFAPKRSTNRSSRAIAAASRGGVARGAAASSRHTCHFPGRRWTSPVEPSTAVVTASRNQRSWATRMTPASIVRRSSSSHSIVSMSRWLVGSSRKRRSGCEASARASDARVSSPLENVASGRSRSSPARDRGDHRGCSLAPVVADGVEARCVSVPALIVRSSCAPAAICRSSSRSSRSSAVRSAVPVSTYSRRGRGLSAGGRWSWSATRRPPARSWATVSLDGGELCLGEGTSRRTPRPASPRAEPAPAARVRAHGNRRPAGARARTLR